MQTDFAPESRSAWPRWAEFLRSHHVEGLAAWALEAAGPLTVLGAQALHFCGALLRPALTDAQRDTLTDLLEDPDEVQALTTFLRKEGRR